MPQQSVAASDSNGQIKPIEDAYIAIPGSSAPIASFPMVRGTWRLYALPEISESKDAQFSDQEILGRSTPVKTYRGSGYRILNVTFHLNSTSNQMKNYNIAFIRAIASLTHPEYNNTYLPPPVAKFKCGTLIDNVNVTCQNYSYTMSPEVVWLGRELFPIYIALQCEFHCVYPYTQLPGASDVIQGRY